jgi:dTDP-4-dehydrorhamnose reductase
MSRRPFLSVVAGAHGQLGRELLRTVPPGWRVVGFGSRELDITNVDALTSTLERERPAVVINAAAYTAVDAAERDVGEAEAVNARGPALLAQAAGRVEARVIHLSTDFVFDGGQGRPYQPDDEPRPLGVYGRTKLAGEKAVLSLGPAGLVMRTAWLYSAWGRNFVLGMLRRMRNCEPLAIVADQVGTPTWARGLAQAVWRAAERSELQGVFHWTDAGVATWYDFAVAIRDEALSLGLIPREVPVQPIRSSEYPTPARRPPFSVLDKSSTWAALDMEPAHWRVNLRRMLRELAGA